MRSEAPAEERHDIAERRSVPGDRRKDVDAPSPHFDSENAEWFAPTSDPKPCNAPPHVRALVSPIDGSMLSPPDWLLHVEPSAVRRVPAHHWGTDPPPTRFQ